MADEFLKFEWAVAHRYWIEDARDGRAIIQGPGIARRYQPLAEHPTLFDELANLAMEEEKILSFAKRYGRLTKGLVYDLPDNEVDDVDENSDQPYYLSADPDEERPQVEEEPPFIGGELLSDWRFHSAKLRFLLTVRKALDSADDRVLERYFSVISKESYSFDYRKAGLADKEAVFTLGLPLGGAVPLADAAWSTLDWLLNEELSGVRASMRYNTRQGRSRLLLRPIDLISAIYLQLARAIDGEREYRKCEQCHRTFEFRGPGGGRSDKSYCSSACRARRWREKNAESSTTMKGKDGRAH